MKWFHQSTISSRIIWSYLFLLAIILVLVFFSIYQLERVNYIATEIEVCWLPATRTLGDINKGLSELRITEYQYVLSHSPDERDSLAQKIQDRIQFIHQEQQIYEPLMVSEEEKNIYHQFCLLWDRYQLANRPILSLSSIDQNSEALSILHGPSKPLYDEMNALLETLININERGGIETSHRGDSIYALSTLQIISLGVFALVIGVIVCIFLTYCLVTTISVTRKYKFISDK